MGKVRAKGDIGAEKCRTLVQMRKTVLTSPKNSPRCWSEYGLFLVRVHQISAVDTVECG